MKSRKIDTWEILFREKSINIAFHDVKNYKADQQCMNVHLPSGIYEFEINTVADFAYDLRSRSSVPESVNEFQGSGNLLFVSGMLVFKCSIEYP
ncbi:MAG TPA: hypothetical protein DET40_11385 [Lentisphaeria bacterium]|nr:hypothetical protein [Lentisphaeria bacterium]